MALLETNWHPTVRQLRQFGGLCLVMLPLLAWLWSAPPAVVASLAAVGLLIAVAGWLYPRALTPLFIAVMLVATPIGMVVGEVVLLVVYTGVFLPIGIVFRMMSRDRLQRRLDRKCKTYWQPKPQPRSVASYYRQS